MSRWWREVQRRSRDNVPRCESGSRSSPELSLRVPPAPYLPDGRIPPGVEAPEDDDVFSRGYVEDAVWERSEEGSPYRSMNDAEGLRVLDYLRQRAP